MSKFPIDAPQRLVIEAFENLGFVIVRKREHISMLRSNKDGTSTPITLPNHLKIKGSTLRRVCTLGGITREEFLAAYDK
ncbi:MAG: hypothetical protein DMF63_10975 [Acidobacteria bacterium]|nr:MAG: hypothetical protein DMF63_10975 [Acidobacteriota bacterium]